MDYLSDFRHKSKCQTKCHLPLCVKKRRLDILSSWELDEIKHLTNQKVYFVGESANKTRRIASNVTNNFGFDHPKESKDVGRYRWVVGDQLNYRYEVLKYLGGGTYGEVLQARDHKFDSLVAVKVLNNYTSM